LGTALRFLAAQPPFPTHLLLRDTLYLLQGIDGRYVRFHVNEAKGFGGGESEDEVVGIEIVADQAKVRTCAQETVDGRQR
jgi:gamma-tubulin complex component 3